MQNYYICRTFGANRRKILKTKSNFNEIVA